MLVKRDQLAAFRETTGKSIGLVGMSERARELCGTLAIGDAPGGGTLLSLRVPLKEQP